jgi:hypothetical protein
MTRAASSNRPLMYLDIIDMDNRLIATFDVWTIHRFYYGDRAGEFFVSTTNNTAGTLFTNVKNINFRVAKIPVSDENWDWEKTLKFGGASYGVIAFENSPFEVLAIVHEKGVKFYDFRQGKEINYANKDIDSKVWDLYPAEKRRLSFFIDDNIVIAGLSYFYRADEIKYVYLTDYRYSTTFYTSYSWSLTGGTNVIPTTITQNADGSVTMSYINHEGVFRTYTFTAW